MLKIAQAMFDRLQCLESRACTAAESGLYSLARELRRKADRVSNVAHVAHRLYALDYPAPASTPWDSPAADLLEACESFNTLYA